MLLLVAESTGFCYYYLKGIHKMKKTLAILLTALLFTGIFAAPASAAISGVVIADAVTMNRGFNKNGTDYFVNLAKNNAGLEFTAKANTFSIDQYSGKIKFNTGLGSFALIPEEVTVHRGGETQVVKVTARYEWYEYFVIVFAAGLFWISAVNN